MHPVIESLKSGLAYATFKNDDVKKKVDNLIDEIDNEMEGDYDHGPMVERAMVDLAAVLDEADDERGTAKVIGLSDSEIDYHDDEDEEDGN